MSDKADPSEELKPYLQDLETHDNGNSSDSGPPVLTPLDASDLEAIENLKEFSQSSKSNNSEGDQDFETKNILGVEQDDWLTGADNMVNFSSEENTESDATSVLYSHRQSLQLAASVLPVHLDEKANIDIDSQSTVFIPSTVEEVAASTSYSGADISPTAKKKRRKRVTANSKCKAKETINKKLWEFLLDKLENSKSNPSVIKWTDKESGIFKICDSNKLAELWTESRTRSIEVRYDFFARALRHYYGKEILRRMPGKKFSYQFGQNCQWQDYISSIVQSETSSKTTDCSAT